MKKPIAVLTAFVVLLCSTPSYAGFANNSKKRVVDDFGGGALGNISSGGRRSFRTVSGSSSLGDFRLFSRNTTSSTCGISFDMQVVPALQIIITKEGLGALLACLLSKVEDRIPQVPTWDGNPICEPPRSGGPAGGGPTGGGGSGGVAAVPEPATLAVWGVLGLASTGAGYRRLRRKSA